MTKKKQFRAWVRGLGQAFLLVGNATTFAAASPFSQSAYLVITSRRRSTAVILR